MRAVVARHNWMDVSGGTLVAAYAARTLVLMGYSVSLASTFPFDVGRIREWFGFDLGGVRVYTSLPFRLRRFGLYHSLFFPRSLGRAVRSEYPDLVFIDNDYYKSILKLKKKIGFKLLHYIHFPYLPLYKKLKNNPQEELYEYEKDTREYYRKYQDKKWNLYFKLWLKLQSRQSIENPFHTADKVLVNSKYTAKLVKLLWNENPTVLNPPVIIDDLLKESHKKWNNRKNTVVTIGRIVPEKHLEKAIEIIAHTETKPTLRIIGGLIKSAVPYLKHLEKTAREHNVKLEVYTNIPRKKLIKLVSESKIFLHTTIGEHFGIVIVEAMASGLPVIVHKSGGPYMDIIEEGRYGLYYDNIEEAAKHIDKLIENEKYWERYHKLSLERCKFYSNHNFIKKLENIIKNTK